jgi:hypothetical protein
VMVDLHYVADLWNDAHNLLMLSVELSIYPGTHLLYLLICGDNNEMIL